MLVWTPCGFLWLFSLLDFVRRRNSRSSHIPWSILNVSKSLVLVLLISMAFVDLAMMVSVSDEFEVFPVHYVSMGVKLATFVSNLNLF